jgi:FAD/FMN-containing dehydrogenase
MQSNNDFSVGGSLSVNCHGWQPNRPPIASTVLSFRLMKADGTIVRCSRLENAELFSLVLGGYGLFGIILDADLQVVPNERYKAETEVLPARDYVVRFAEQVDRAPVDVGLAYGRLDIVPGEKTFLQEAILTVFRRCPCKKEEIPPLKDESYAALRRDIYRAQIGSDSGKKLRWQAEKKLAPLLDRHFVCRNQLLDEPVELYQERSAERIAPDQVPVFLDRVRAIVPKHRGDLLNVTVRDVRQDKDTFLRYADRDMFGFVMLFTQRRTPDADSAMEAMTRDLIDAAFQSGGRYYLPYRLHAAKEQFTRAYPQASAFFERKRRYDPDELFQNRFYMKYALP